MHFPLFNVFFILTEDSKNTRNTASESRLSAFDKAEAERNRQCGVDGYKRKLTVDKLKADRDVLLLKSKSKIKKENSGKPILKEINFDTFNEAKEFVMSNKRYAIIRNTESLGFIAKLK